MNIIFCGTPKVVIPIIENLRQQADFNLSAIITQPDKPAGRGLKITPPPVALYAKQHNIPLMQPEKITEITNKIAALNPDYVVVAAYAQLIPQIILNIPKYGCINIHGSLLPRWRGASCVQAAILADDKQTGPTIMQMARKLDAGPIIWQSAFDITPTADSVQLLDKIAKTAAQALPNILRHYASGELPKHKQDEQLATYAPLLQKNDGRIDWTKSTREIDRLARAMHPWPSAWDELNINGKTKRIILRPPLKIIKNNSGHAHGTVYKIGDSYAVACANGSIML